MTDAAFNQAFANIRFKGNVKDPNKTANEIAASGPYYYDQRILPRIGIAAGTGERPILPGDRVTFRNPDGAQLAWKFENAIYMGDGMFYCPGLMPEQCYFGTEQEVIDALNALRTPGSTTSASLDRGSYYRVVFPAGN